MNGDELRFWVTIVVVVGGWLASWGDLRRQVSANRERSDERAAHLERVDGERHADNVARLEEIRDDVKRINGTVAAHGEALDQIEGRIDRIQQQPRRPQK